MQKISEAFRNISEVADELDVPKHVLRFWEAKFVQLKPMKRGGGRRYYRPEDVLLLKGIRQLLYSDGYTIRGVQKLLREQGVDYVKSCSPTDEQETSQNEKSQQNKGIKHEPGKVVSLKDKRDQSIGSATEDKSSSLSSENNDQRETLLSALNELENCKKILHSSRN